MKLRTRLSIIALSLFACVAFTSISTVKVFANTEGNGYGTDTLDISDDDDTDYKEDMHNNDAEKDPNKEEILSSEEKQNTLENEKENNQKSVAAYMVNNLPDYYVVDDVCLEEHDGFSWDCVSIDDDKRNEELISYLNSSDGKESAENNKERYQSLLDKFGSQIESILKALFGSN